MRNYFEMNGNKISAHAFVSPNAIIGKNNVIEEGVIIRDGVVIGDNNYIGPYCIIGERPESKNYLKGFNGKVVIGNNNHLFKQVTIDAGTERPTTIDDNCLLLKNSHVGHDAIIKSKVRLSCNATVCGHTIVCNDAILGVGAVVHQRLVVPPLVIIGMNTVITKTTKLMLGYVYGGVPAKKIKKRP